MVPYTHTHPTTSPIVVAKRRSSFFWKLELNFDGLRRNVKQSQRPWEIREMGKERVNEIDVKLKTGAIVRTTHTPGREVKLIFWAIKHKQNCNREVTE